ncbi:type 1 fimbrial protein [Salmonella enterica]|nr:type 1 fimbrial protein [Salmonella enterica]EBP8095943.1 type 1 fimbrial protein [Salmonella enterica]
MRLNKRTAGCGVWLPVVLAALLPAGAVASTASVTVPVTATFVAPTCTLSLPNTTNATHNIGSLQTGTDTTYARLNIMVDCNNGLTVGRLYASTVSGTPDGSGGLAVKMNGSGSATSANPPVLQMLDGKNPVTLNGSGASSDSGTFCYGTTTRICTLTPRVNVPANAEAGSAKVSLRFTLRYS